MLERHGGQVTVTEEFQFEVVFSRDAVQLYLYDGEKSPVSAEEINGTVRFAFRGLGGKSSSLELAYVGSVDEEKGAHGHEKGNGRQQQDFLQAKVDLNKLQEGDMIAGFALKNLPGEKEKEVEFRESFKLARLVEYACPMKDSKPALHPGKCEKCGMGLNRVTYAYSCSMHPMVTSRGEGEKCWACGMNMTRVDDHHQSKDKKHEGNDHHH
jgi:hypothetical protein